MDYDDDNHSELMCLALSQMWCASIQAFFFHGDSEDSEGPEDLQAQWFETRRVTSEQMRAVYCPESRDSSTATLLT